MRILIISSYLCSFFGFVLVLCFLFISINAGDTLNDGVLKSLLLILPGFQFWYVRRTANALRYPEYKSTNSLDDFAMNENEPGDLIITNHFLIKVMNTVNTGVLSLMFYYLASEIIGLVTVIVDEFSELLHGGFAGKLAAISALILPLFLLTILPTIIFNLRTYSLSRVVSVKMKL